MKVISYPQTPLEDTLWESIDKSRVLAGTPQMTYRVFHASPSGEFSSGIYECTTGKWHVSYTEDEFCTLIAGHVRLTNEQGDSAEFKAPASFMIPAGYNGTWESVTPVRKFFVIYEKEK